MVVIAIIVVVSSPDAGPLLLATSFTEMALSHLSHRCGEVVTDVSRGWMLSQNCKTTLEPGCKNDPPNQNGHQKLRKWSGFAKSSDFCYYVQQRLQKYLEFVDISSFLGQKVFKTCSFLFGKLVRNMFGTCSELVRARFR